MLLLWRAQGVNMTTQGYSSVARYSLSSAFRCVNFRNHWTIIKSRAQRHPGACPVPSFQMRALQGMSSNGVVPSHFSETQGKKNGKIGSGTKKKKTCNVGKNRQELWLSFTLLLWGPAHHVQRWQKLDSFYLLKLLIPNSRQMSTEREGRDRRLKQPPQYLQKWQVYWVHHKGAMGRTPGCLYIGAALLWSPPCHEDSFDWWRFDWRHGLKSSAVVAGHG